MDSTELDYTNWNTNNPMYKNNQTNTCIEMTTESDPDGKWVNKPCQASNKVICEKPQQWSMKKLIDTLYEIKGQLAELKQHAIYFHD